MGSEAVEQPNSKQVWGRSAEIVTGEARRGLWGGMRGWSAGRLDRRSLRSDSIFVAFPLAGGKVFAVWSEAESGQRRDVAERKAAKSSRGGAGGLTD